MSIENILKKWIFVLVVLSLGCTKKESTSWCDQPLRPELSKYREVETGQEWFKVYEVGEGVYAIMEPYNFQEVISYLVVGSKRNVLFDTGMGMGKISDVVRKLSPLPIVVINSHTHSDHIGGNHEFDTVFAVDTAFTRTNAANGSPHSDQRPEVTPASFCMQKLPSLDTAKYAILPYQDKISGYIHDGDTLQLGDRVLEVMQVPGHTPDCVALLDRQHGYLWTGDMFYEAHIWLFMEGTDLDAYAKSIDRFAALAADLQRVFPAHNKPVAIPSHLVDLKLAFDSVRTGKKPGEPMDPSGYPGFESALQFTFRDFSFLVRKELLN